MRLLMHGGYLFIPSQLLPKSILNRLRRWILALLNHFLTVSTASVLTWLNSYERTSIL